MTSNWCACGSLNALIDGNVRIPGDASRAFRLRRPGDFRYNQGGYPRSFLTTMEEMMGFRQERLSMRKVREILRLKYECQTDRWSWGKPAAPEASCPKTLAAQSR